MRTHTFLNKSKLVEQLTNLDKASRFLALQLVSMGYVRIEPLTLLRRGRPAHVYVLTGKGRGYVALARNWGKRASNLRQYHGGALVTMQEAA